ncbi:RNA 2',3'-cyclic phosphodiesterase [Virgibacillus ihumii]|uniref:RNA 2',3'-cyclic phosphodiesterase n=1 Tax=Virgibacillus ihumii TaxID=2686091 RepID=UPI00157CCAD0|nr:RNA 2',3'-cyclic phosphodiesterase [Virgibacillus ihumii]
MAGLPHYFIAVPLPMELKQYLYEQQQQLKQLVPYKQWPHPEDLHITLKFLGPVSPAQLNQLKEKLEKVTDLYSFRVRTGSLGTFGKSIQPRVLWAGVEKTAALLKLQQLVEGLVNEAGFEQEKRTYSPHITLAKKWNDPTEKFPELEDTYVDTYQLTVHQVVIYRIFPQSIPKYNQIAVYQLKGAGGS